MSAVGEKWILKDSQNRLTADQKYVLSAIVTGEVMFFIACLFSRHAVFRDLWAGMRGFFFFWQQQIT